MNVRLECIIIVEDAASLTREVAQWGEPFYHKSIETILSEVFGRPLQLGQSGIRLDGIDIIELPRPSAYKITFNALIEDLEALARDALASREAMWRDARDWRPESVEELLFERLLSSNENTHSPADYGISIEDWIRPDRRAIGAVSATVEHAREQLGLG